MSLDNKFQDIELTRAQLRRLKRNALNEQFKKKKKPFPQEKVHDSFKTTYDIVAVKNLFKGTDISEEVISQELQKIEAKKEKKVLMFAGIKKNLLSLKPLVLAGCIAGAILGNTTARYITDLTEFDTLYDTVLIQYGDGNKDGLISPGEEYTFRKEVLNEHNVIYRAGDRMVDSKYPDGKSVPISDLTQWLKEYDQKKSSITNK